MINNNILRSIMMGLCGILSIPLLADLLQYNKIYISNCFNKKYNVHNNVGSDFGALISPVIVRIAIYGSFLMTTLDNYF